MKVVSMPRTRLVCTFVVLPLFLLLAAMQGICFANSKPRIAIQLFEDRSGAGAPAEGITEMMTTELMNTGLFTILEREKLTMMTTEQDLAQSGLGDARTAPERGKLKGAEFSMTGAITEYRYDSAAGALPIGNVGISLGSHTATVMLDIRIVNNRTGEVIMAAREKGSSNQTVAGLCSRYGSFGGGKTGGILAGATHKVVLRLINKITTDGLARMQGASGANKADEASGGSSGSVSVLTSDAPRYTTATINAGLDHGVRKGALFAVYRAGNVVKDMNGNVLGEDRQYIAVLKVTNAQAAFSRCTVIKLAKGRSITRGLQAEMIASVNDVVVR